jgi:hypothetical protein
MLVGRPRSRGSRYIDIVGDGVWVATWRRAQWGDPGQLSAAGYGYTVRGPSFGMRSELLAPNGRVVAYTHRFGPRRWTLTTDDRDYVFVDATPARHGVLLVDGDVSVGRIRLSQGRTFELQAYLPTTALVPATFAMIVALTRWEQQAGIAAYFLTGALSPPVVG